MKQQLQSGKTGIPSLAQAATNTGAIDVTLKKVNDETAQNQDQQDNDNLKPKST